MERKGSYADFVIRIASIIPRLGHATQVPVLGHLNAMALGGTNANLAIDAELKAALGQGRQLLNLKVRVLEEHPKT